MDSRPILKDAKEIRVFIDSKTFDDPLKQTDRIAYAILRYYDSDILDFVMTPFETNFDELKNVVRYELKQENSIISSIKITEKEYDFGYRIEDITAIAKKYMERILLLRMN